MIYRSKSTLIGSTKENFKLLDVLPLEVYNKITIVYIIKREIRAFDVRTQLVFQKSVWSKMHRLTRPKKLQINVSKYKKGHNILYRRESYN